MDIVDAQVHANVIGTEGTLAAMDALGIQAVLLDEYLGTDENYVLHPAHMLPGGVSRPIGPNAEAAALKYPDRFAYLMRINPHDPGLEGWIETLAASPGLRALRAIVFGRADGAAFEEGGCDRLFAAADKHGLPMFVTCPARVPHLAPYAKRFPNLQIVIDHCGVAFNAPPGQASIDDALAMAQHPNIAFKWAHAPSFLSTAPYPFPDLEPKLKQVVEAFGRERVMWASDYTVSRHRQSWAEALFSIRHAASLSDTDKEWILGRTLRTMLRWPAPAQPSYMSPLHPQKLC